MLELKEESETEEAMQVDVANMRRKGTRASASTPAEKVNRRLFKEESPEGSMGWDIITAESITAKELQLIAKKRAKEEKALSKKVMNQALTGMNADFPSLSHCWSMEVGLNIAHSVASRMRTFMWKKFLWQLRVKAAVEKTVGPQGAGWKRNPRWLSLLEVGSLWGHVGSLRQKITDPKVWHLL